MGDAEIFHFDEGGSEGGSEGSFEQFKEKFKQASQQIANIKKEEKKHKKKEDRLAKILLKFIKSSQKKELVMLLARALEQNLPAEFLLAVILLSNRDVMEKAEDYLLLKAPENPTEDDEKNLTFFGDSDEFPLKVRIELDHWIKNMLDQASEVPQKLLKNSFDIEYIEIKRDAQDETSEDYDDEDEESYDSYKRKQDKKYREEKTIKVILIQLIAFVIQDYFDQKDISEPYDKIRAMAEFIIKGILMKTKEFVDDRKYLKGEVAEEL
ncbi:MAG: hypothetical protein WC269_01500 [Candidatus Gracilibacteria bacterium]|jgi:hypothetical protein